MLDEYFSLSISEEGRMETLPMLLKGYTPNLDRLPHFLLCLGTQVSRPSTVRDPEANGRSIGKMKRDVSKHSSGNSRSSTPLAHFPIPLHPPTEMERRVKRR